MLGEFRIRISRSHSRPKWKNQCQCEQGRARHSRRPIEESRVKSS